MMGLKFEVLLQLAKDRDFDRILAYAAECGNESLCRYAKKRGAKNISEMYLQAALNGHERICLLAFEWGAEMLNPMQLFQLATEQNFEELLVLGATHGNEPLCRLAKEWGATDFERMLDRGADNRHIGICRLAKEWGATDFDLLLDYAEEYGDEPMRHLANADMPVICTTIEHMFTVCGAPCLG
jgi:hypothetical protein